MNDYKKALEEGFEAARLAESARKEIASVLAEFFKQVLEGSDGKIALEIKQYEEEKTLADLYTMSNVFGKTLPKTYKALSATNPKLAKSPVYQIARWKQARNGYPCTLTFNQSDMELHDRLALENGLTELLRDPRVGEALYKLINLE